MVAVSAECHFLLTGHEQQSFIDGGAQYALDGGFAGGWIRLEHDHFQVEQIQQNRSDR